MLHPNQITLEKFYGAFVRLDVDTTATCYAPGAKLAVANLQKFIASRKTRS